MGSKLTIKTPQRSHWQVLKNDPFLLTLLHGLLISDDRTEIFWSIFAHWLM